MTDRESAEVWLGDQMREIRVAFAARCALRVFPCIAHADPVILGGLVLPIIRAALTSTTAALSLTPEMEELARSSADAAETATKEEADAASSAADAAYFSSPSPDKGIPARQSVLAESALVVSAASATLGAVHSVFADPPESNGAGSAQWSANCAQDQSADVWAANNADANRLDVLSGRVAPIFSERLWLDRQPPDGISNALKELRNFWRHDRKTWGFWSRWYEGFLDGHPLDWDLQREVALIPDEDWEKGPKHIARMIAEIEARHLANAVAERIDLAPSGRLTLVPRKVPEDRHLGLLIDTVRDALDLATSGIRNELPEDAYQVRLLRRTFARYGNDPQRIEMDFERARVSLIEDIAADAIPASAPNRDLVQALSDAAGAIRDSDAEIARNRERLNRIRLGQVSPEDAARIAEAAEQVAGISEGVLRDDLLEDRFRLPGVRRDAGTPDPVVPLGAAERNAALEAQAAQLRLYSRLAKVWLFLKAHDRDVALAANLATIVTLIVAFVAP